MAALVPFQTAVQSGAAGNTQSVPLGAGAATAQLIKVAASVANTNGDMLVTVANNNSSPGATLTAYVRMTLETSTVIIAECSTGDFPICVPQGGTGVRLFAAPSSVGAYNVAIIVSVTPSTAGQAWFTPGQGGIL